MTDPTEGLDLDALERLCERATGGPWHGGGIFDPDSDHPTTSIYGPRAQPDHQSGPCVARYVTLHDAAFIIAFNPVTAAQLIATIRALQAENKQLHSDLDKVRDDHTGYVNTIDDLDNSRVLLIAQCEALASQLLDVQRDCVAALARVAELEAVLEFYAWLDNYSYVDGEVPAMRDKGQRARAALGQPAGAEE